MPSTGTLVFNDQKLQAPEMYATESLGVGVSVPTSNLEVTGNAYVSSNLEIGTANLFVDTTTGRVGIGTATPSTPLHIVDINPEITLMSTGASSGETSGMRFYGTFANYPSDTGDRRAADIQAGFRNGSSAGAWGHQFMSFHVGKGNNNNDNEGLNNERMCITGHGRVGVGTDDPAEALHVHANDSSHTQLTLHNQSASHRTGIRIKNAAGDSFNIQHIGGVGQSSNAAVIENFSTTNGGIEFYNKGDGKYTFRTTDSNNLRFSILNNGNVGVGDITPSSKLHVDGDVRMKTLSTNAIGKITPVYARGTGANNNANRIVRIGDTTHVNGTGRGLTLTIINASTHAHVSSAGYDTYGSQTESNNLATALEGMTDAQIGILTSWDAFEDNMTGNLITACFKLGLTRLAGANDDNNRHPYCAIFYGLGDTTGGGNHAIEVMKADRAGSAYATLSTFLVADSFMGQTVTNALYSGTADNTTPSVFVNKDKNVGIGTTSPVAQLHVASHGPTYTGIGGNDRFRIEELVTNGNRFGLQMGIDWGTGNSTLQTYALSSGGSYSQNYDLLIQPHGGGVGIGTTSPQGSLHIDTASNGEIMIGAITSSHATAPMCMRDIGGNQIHFYYGHTQVGKITSSSTSTSYQTSSDYRLKENVIPLVSALERVNDLPVYRFNFITDTEKTVDGFFAHEVQSVVPEAIHGVKDGTEDIGVITNIEDGKTIKSDVTEPTKLKEGTEWTYTGSRPVYQSIDHSKLVPLLTRCIQELSAKNDALEARIAALENA